MTSKASFGFPLPFFLMKWLKALLPVILIMFCSAQALAQDIFQAARTGNVSRIEQLYTIDPDTINVRNENGFTPLILAGYYNQLSAVEFLLTKHVDINATSPEGPVILGACYKGYFELTQLLIKYKANVNAQNQQGTSALMFATISANIELVNLLLSNGADKNLMEKSGRTALSYAQMFNSEDLIKLLSN